MRKRIRRSEEEGDWEHRRGPVCMTMKSNPDDACKGFVYTSIRVI